MPWWGCWLVSGPRACVCVRVQLFESRIWISAFKSHNALLFKWLFQSVIFYGLKQKTATLIVSRPRLLFSFIKAWKCREKENDSMREYSCSPWLGVLYHMAKILRAFMCGIYQVFRNEVHPQRTKWFIPRIFSSQQGNMSAMLCRAGSLFVLNRFFVLFELRWQRHNCGVVEQEAGREYWNEGGWMQVQGLWWSSMPQKAKLMLLKVKAL